MNPERKIARIRRLIKALERELESVDYGSLTEYLDRACDQLYYAIEEATAEEAEFQASID